MYDTVLVPTDGSDIASITGEVAIAVAARFDATIEALYVSTDGSPEPSPDAQSEARNRRGQDALAKIEKRAADAAVESTTALVEANGSDPIYRTILDYADSSDTDLIVMGTHGRTGVGRIVLGSVTEQTLRESPVPVMALHENTAFSGDFDSLLVPTDGSDAAESALDHGIELALTTGATLHIISVVDVGAVAGSYNVEGVADKLREGSNEALGTAVERAEDAGVSSIESTVLTGAPGRSICEYANQHGIDTIAMGTRGLTGVERLVLGSVTERVVRRSPVPVIGTKATITSDHTS